MSDEPSAEKPPATVRRNHGHDRLTMAAITMLSAMVIALVLYLAGAFTRSTG